LAKLVFYIKTLQRDGGKQIFFNILFFYRGDEKRFKQKPAVRRALILHNGDFI
jgi:hypothetical protein